MAGKKSKVKSPVGKLPAVNPVVDRDERLGGIVYHAYYAAKGQGKAPAFAQAAWSKLTVTEKLPWMLAAKAVLAAVSPLSPGLSALNRRA